MPDYYYPPHETVECTYTVTVAPPPADSAEARLLRGQKGGPLRLTLGEAEHTGETAADGFLAHEVADGVEQGELVFTLDGEEVAFPVRVADHVEEA